MLFSSISQIVSNAPETGLAGALAYDVASSAIGISSEISATLANYGFDDAFVQNLRTHMLLNHLHHFWGGVKVAITSRKVRTR